MLKRRILATAVAAAMSLTTGLAVAQSTPEESLSAIIDKVNDALEAQGSEVRLFSAEVMSRGRSGRHHRKTHWRKWRFDRVDAEYVPFDTRRTWSGPVDGKVDDITFAIDQTDAVPQNGGLTAAQTTAAIRRAMSKWDSVRCSGLVLTEVPAHSSSGIVAWIMAGMPGGQFGVPAIPADILHAGFRLSGWSALPKMDGIEVHDDIIAVTFTFVGTGSDADIDNNDKADIAFQEIYYNADVTWKIDSGERRRGHHGDDDRRGRNRGDGGRNRGDDAKQDEAFDVQTVALHETGHALSLEHFPKEVELSTNGRFDRKPEAVMHPVYAGTQQHLTKYDVAAHCIGGWKAWPRARR
jgi:hypothetical protein